MSFSLQTATCGAYLQILPAVASMLDKAMAHCEANGVAHETLLQTSIAPDMWNFAKQIQQVAHHSAGAIKGISIGEFGPAMAPPPADFDGLKAMIADAIAVVESVDADDINGRIGADMAFVFGERRMPFTAEDFLLTFSLPNFYFHASAAYAILRGEGLAVGKMDFLGKLRMKG